MNKIFKLLEKNKAIAIVILLTYYTLVVLPHEQVGKLIVLLFEQTTRKVYQTTMLAFFGLLFISLSIAITRKIVKSKHPYFQLSYLSFTLLAIVIAFKLLVIHNVEAIHFLQYFGFALLIFPLVNSTSRTIFWSTLAGFIDEAYQYLYLAPDATSYFDFNDVILNQLGAGLAIIAIMTFITFETNNKRGEWYKQIEVQISILITVIILAAFHFNILSVYPNSNPETLFILLKKPNIEFWNTIEHLKVTYHIVKPIEGMIILSLLGCFYATLDLQKIKKKYE